MSVATSFSSVVVTELHGYVDTLVGFVRQLPNLVWVYGTIVALCFYIFHRLIETRSEKNNIWEIASLDKKSKTFLPHPTSCSSAMFCPPPSAAVETKLLEKEKEEEKQKDKLERRKLRAKKQRIMLSIFFMQRELFLLHVHSLIRSSCSVQSCTRPLP